MGIAWIVAEIMKHSLFSSLRAVVWPWINVKVNINNINNTWCILMSEAVNFDDVGWWLQHWLNSFRGIACEGYIHARTGHTRTHTVSVLPWSLQSHLRLCKEYKIEKSIGPKWLKTPFGAQNKLTFHIRTCAYARNPIQSAKLRLKNRPHGNCSQTPRISCKCHKLGLHRPGIERMKIKAASLFLFLFKVFRLWKSLRHMTRVCVCVCMRACECMRVCVSLASDSSESFEVIIKLSAWWPPQTWERITC